MEKYLYTCLYTDIKFTPTAGKTLTLSPEQLRQLAGVKGVKDLSLVAEDKALLENGESRAIAYLKGVDEKYTRVTGVAGKLRTGKFELGAVDEPLAFLGTGV